VGIWQEVKVKYSASQAGVDKCFDYTFDYVLRPLGRVATTMAQGITGRSLARTEKLLDACGCTCVRIGDHGYVDDFPVGPPLLVEIMTSSTSGGDKTKGTTIPMAFCKAVQGRSHQAPGINYRQVWARMVSQLIVKSEVGLAWGGKTFWIIQDTLADYISSTTALDLRRFLTTQASEVNMLSLSYGETFKRSRGPLEIGHPRLLAGPISCNAAYADGPCFQDMVRTPIIPPVEALVRSLIGRPRCATITIP
jgi:hypothetical protein